MSATDTKKKKGGDKAKRLTKPKEIENRTPSLRVTPLPENTNHRGDIFGGWLQSQMDLAGAVRAWEESGKNIATRFAETSFEQPILVGDIVSFFTEVAKIGKTSIAIDIEVWALRRKARVYDKVASGRYTYVAIDKDKSPVSIGLEPTKK